MSDHPHAPMIPSAPDGPTRREPQAFEVRFEQIKAQLHEEWRLKAQGIHHDHLSDLSVLITEVEFLQSQLEQRDAQLTSLQEDIRRRDETITLLMGRVEDQKEELETQRTATITVLRTARIVRTNNGWGDMHAVVLANRVIEALEGNNDEQR